MYEFITVGGGEYFVDIFNALAMLINSGNFMTVTAIASTLAFVIAMLNSALQGSLYNAGRWFLTTVIIMEILLFPKASVHITDKTNNALMGAQVDNVPFVVAYVASVTSQIDYALTSDFEAAYSLPSDLQYSQNGMIFGANLMSAYSQAKIDNAYLASSIDSFVQNCIFYDLSFGIYSFEDLKNSDDIWAFVKSSQVENRFFTYTDSNGDSTYPTCKAGAASLDTDWTKQLQSFSPSNLGFFAKKPDLTTTLLSSATPLATDYFFDISKTSQQLLQQTMMANAISDAVINQEAESQIQLYENAKASMQAKSTYQTIGAQAGIWIPILKIVIEAVFIGAFPIVVVASLIPNLTGMVLRGYFTTFCWLASWGPIYAILHRIAMGHAKTYTLSFANGLGITLANQATFDQSMSDIAAMAGYMSMFVPMLSYGIAKGGAAAMSSMTTSFMSGVQGAASAAAMEGTSGNISMGNVAIGQRHAYAGVSIMNDAGQILHRHNDGSTAIDNSGVESRLGIDVRGNERIESAYSNQIGHEQSLAQTRSIESSQTRAHGFEMMINNHRSIESSNGYEKNLSSEEKSAFSKINNAVSDFAKEHGISRETSAEIFGRVGGGLSAGIGGKDKIGGGNLDLGINGQLAGRSSDQDHYKEALNYSKQHSLSKDFAVVQSAVQAHRLNYSDARGESLNETFNNAASLNREAGIHFENAKKYSEQEQFIKSQGIGTDKNYNQELWGDLVDKYGESGAAAITNPNNRNKVIFNQEITDFFGSKAEEISAVQKPNLAIDYRNQEVSFGKDHALDQTHSDNPYKFSENSSHIDNSNLRDVTPEKFLDTQQKINQAQKSNSEIGAKVIKQVKKEEDEGLL